MIDKARNPVLEATVKALKKAHKKTGSPIWEVVVERLSSSRSRRITVNIGKIARLTEEGEVILVPGKVLGGGILPHRAIIGAYSFSGAAKRKVLKSGGEALSLVEFLERYPEGRGVTLMGG